MSRDASSYSLIFQQQNRLRNTYFEEAQARWELLQYITRDWKCFSPDEFGRDCGSCLRCYAAYRDGAVKWREKTGGYIPGMKTTLNDS